MNVGNEYPLDRIVVEAIHGTNRNLDKHLTAQEVTKLRISGQFKSAVPEKIIGHRIILGTRQFLIKYVGYEPVLAIYISEFLLGHMKEKLLDYLRRNNMSISIETPDTPSPSEAGFEDYNNILTDDDLNIPFPGEVILYVHHMRRQISKHRFISNLVLEQYPGKEELLGNREEGLYLIQLNAHHYIYHFHPSLNSYTIADGANFCHIPEILEDHEHITGHKLNRLTCTWQRGEDQDGSSAVLIALWVMRERAQGRRLTGLISVVSKKFWKFVVKKTHLGRFRKLPGPKMTCIRPDPCRYCAEKGKRVKFRTLNKLLCHQRAKHKAELERDKV